MARKKSDSVAQKQQAPAVEVDKIPMLTKVSGPAETTEVGPKHFSQKDLHQLEMVQVHAMSAQRALDLHKLKIELFQRDVQEKLREAQKELDRLGEEYQYRAKELQTFYTELEAAYGVVMKDLSYDPKTGLIRQPVAPA